VQQGGKMTEEAENLMATIAAEDRDRRLEPN
jgi:hypothetical protein